MNSRARDLVRKLRKQGFDIEHTRRGHLKVSRDGGPFVIMPSTPSEYRGMKNAESLLKKIGYKPPK